MSPMLGGQDIFKHIPWAKLANCLHDKDEHGNEITVGGSCRRWDFVKVRLPQSNLKEEDDDEEEEDNDEDEDEEDDDDDDDDDKDKDKSKDKCRPNKVKINQRDLFWSMASCEILSVSKNRAKVLQCEY